MFLVLALLACAPGCGESVPDPVPAPVETTSQPEAVPTPPLVAEVPTVESQEPVSTVPVDGPVSTPPTVQDAPQASPAIAGKPVGPEP